jgi:hypothetical protein
MDRDLGKPKKSETSTGMFAGLTRAPADLPMKQTSNAFVHSLLPGIQLEQRLPPKRTTKTAR